MRLTLLKKQNSLNYETKISDVNSLAIKTALTAVENKIPDVRSFVKKTDYNTKITETENELNIHNHGK